MKSFTQFVEGMTDPAYRKNPQKWSEIEDQTKILSEDIVKTMEDYCENDEQKSDFLHKLISNIWFGMEKGTRRKILLPVLKNFVD